MRYTENNITFDNVKPAGVYHASGPIGLNGSYSVSGDLITNINPEFSLVNAVDINWNGANVDAGVKLNTTADLLKWIKTKSNNSQGVTDISINSEGYWCINGISTGVKARGDNGISPHIGPNGNWWIGTEDTGVPAAGSTAIALNVAYYDAIGNAANRYRLGTLIVGPKEYPINAIKYSGGDGESESSENTFDPSSIWDKINQLEEQINSLASQDELYVKEKAKEIIEDYNYIKNNFPWGEIFHYGGWDEAWKLYFQRVGLINSDGTGATWSTFILKYNELTTKVNAVYESIGNNGEIDLQVLEAGLKNYIDGQVARVDLKTLWALTDSDKNVLKWLLSGFESYANQHESFARVFADHSNGEFQNLANLITQAKDNGDAIASLTAKTGSNFAGLITETNLDEAVSSLFAKNGDTKAAVMAVVENGLSNVHISADLINLDGDTIFRLLSSASLSGISYDGQNTIELDSKHLKFLEKGFAGALDISTSVNPGHINLYDSVNYGETIIGSGRIELYNGQDSDVSINIGNGYGYFLNGISIGSEGFLDINGVNLSCNGNRLKINKGVNIDEGDLLLSDEGVKLYNNLNELQVSIKLDSELDLIFSNDSGNSSKAVIFNSFGTLYASTIECDEIIDGTSDERIKENIVPVNVNISDIANSRIVNFNFIGKEETKFGSIALDWESIFPNAIKENSKGNLTMDYGAIALGSAVTAAREIVALKKENQQLKDRLEAIENKINNKL